MASEDLTGTGAFPQIPEPSLDETTRAALSEVHQRIDKMKTEYSVKFEDLIGTFRETQVLIKNSANNMSRLEEIQKEGARQQTEIRDVVRDLVNSNGHLTKKMDIMGAKVDASETRVDEACDKANDIVRAQEMRLKETQQMKAVEEGKKKRWQTFWDKVLQGVITAVVLGALLLLGNAAWQQFKGEVHDDHNTPDTEAIDDLESQ